MQWRSFGTGSPLVLLHGGHGTWLHWIRNIEALSRQHQLWIPDLPGFGDSDDASPADQVAPIVDAVVLALGQLIGDEQPVDMAAFSFGTLVANRVAARRPLRKVALLGAAGHRADRRAYPPMVNWRRIEGSAEKREALTHNLAAFMLHDANRSDPLAVAAYELSCLNTRFRSKDLALASSLPEMLAAYSAPVLLAWGDYDVTIDDPAAVAPRMCAGRSGAEWRVIANAGHWVQFEQAQAIDALLLDWFK